MKKSLKYLLLNEDLDKYHNKDGIGNPAKAASQLKKLIETMVPIIEKSLKIAGPLVAQSLIDDFSEDLKAALKQVKIPTVSNLDDIMSQVDRKEKELDQKEEELNADDDENKS